MSLSHTTDHEAEGIALLISQFRDKAKLEILLRAWLEQVQALEDAFWDLYVKRSIDAGEGVMLDVIGRIVGQPRGANAADAAYRPWLRARVLVNKSKGKPEQLIQIVRVVVDEDPLVFGGVPIRAEELYPASFVLYADAPIRPDDGAGLGQLIGEAKALGVNASFHFHRIGVFRYSADGVPVDDDPAGFDRGEYAAVSDGGPARYPGKLDFSNLNDSHWLGVF